jgi:L-lactate dehydrogenase complex protein LldE
MIKLHYPEIFAGEENWKKRSKALSEKTFELVSFLTDQLNVTSVKASYKGNVTYHDSCSGLRELGIKEQPRVLLGSVQGLDYTELSNADVCCGFGGVFCIKYSEISTRMVQDKIGAVAESGADTLVAGDMGCLLNMAGRLTREGYKIEARHVSEILSGMANGPAIGHSRTNIKS